MFFFFLRPPTNTMMKLFSKGYKSCRAEQREYFTIYTTIQHTECVRIYICVSCIRDMRGFGILAALINICIWTVGQLTTRMWNGLLAVTNLNLQFPSALWSVLASIRSLFWFYSLQLYYFDPLSAISWRNRQLFSVKKVWQCMLCAQHQMARLTSIWWTSWSIQQLKSWWRQNQN